MLQFVLDRAKEPSTYAGVATLLAAGGLPVNADLFHAGVTLAVAAAGFVAMLLPEGKGGAQ